MPHASPSYTVTPGAKFGGDLLAYPGDPDAVHARFVVRLALWATCGSGLQAVGRARVAISARKLLVIATAAPEGGAALQLGAPVYSVVVSDGRMAPFDLPDGRD